MADGDRTDIGPRGLPTAGDPRPGDDYLAPPPIIDRHPIVIGQGVSLAYISAVFRIATSGFRQQYVDLLDELLEKDPHAYSVIAKRANGVAGARLELEEPDYPNGSDDARQAAECKALCEQQLFGIPALNQHLTSLAWGVFYGIAGLENHWRRDGAGWVLDRFSFVHSRRLAYPRPMSWDLHVWDPGTVSSYGYAYGQQPMSPLFPNPRGKQAPTEGFYGLRVADYPGKFTIHAPQVRGDYPTREGIGREIAYWMALKLIASRGASNYLERFARPTPEATYKTGTPGPDGKGGDTPRPATKEDIADAKAAMRAFGAGSQSSWVHPDSVEFAMRTPETGSTGKLTYDAWMGICDGQMSKAALGGTLSTEVGHAGGNRALGEVQKKGETLLFKQDAFQLADSLRRDVLYWIVFLNKGAEAARKYTPRATLHVDDDPDPMRLIERAARAAASGVPVDADWLADEVGLKVVAPDDKRARRMFPIQAVKGPEMFDEDLRAREQRIAAEYGPTAGEQAQQAAAGTSAAQNEPAATADGTPDNETEPPDAGEEQEP